MRHTTTALLLTAGLLLAGCSSGATPTPSSPAQKLADLDGGTHSVAEYQTALDAWAARCTESPEKLAGYTYAALDDLQKNGVNDETEYTVLAHLKDATPAGSRMRCEDVAAGYLTLRESNGS
jgi:ABC-type enterochelin transport system substrate-binding protein